MIIAIDHGNYAIKTVNHSFIAGVSEYCKTADSRRNSGI